MRTQQNAAASRNNATPEESVADVEATSPPTSPTGNVALPHRGPVRTVEKRRRKTTTKVKTGCLTCKARRVKCDEGKPSCQRCVKLGFTCGYELPKSPRQKVAKVYVILPKEEPTSPSLSPISKILRLYGGDNYLDEGDGQCFRLYLEEFATNIHSVFPSSLWERLIPQISEVEPFVRHAIVAIGALAKQSRIDSKQKTIGHSSQSTDYHHALKQYDKSLRGMRDAIANGQQDLRKALIACLLVYCFENMLGNQLSAAKHAESGLMLLYQWTTSRNIGIESTDKQKVWEDDLFEEDLLVAFNALDLQVLLFVDNRTKLVHEKMKESQNRIINTMPERFTSLLQARQYWCLVMTRNYHFNKSIQGIDIEKIQEQRLETTPWEDSANLQTGELLLSDPKAGPSSLMDEHMRYRIDIDRWTLASARLFADLANGKDEREKVGSQILQIQAKVNHIMLVGSFLTTETAYDAFARDFKDIVMLSESIIPYILHTYEGAAPRFHVDIGIVAALYLVGSRCRVYEIRTRAIELLFKANIREGAWDALSVACMARWIRDVEMEGLEKGGVVPEEKRAFLSKVNVDLANKRAIVGITQRTGEGVKQREKLLIW